jgi:alpha-tubulin suppressor-like RCC1 family protein
MEECDGDDLAGRTCESLGEGFNGGALACGSDCTLDISGCYNCGDGTCEPGEGPLVCAEECAAVHVATSRTTTCEVLIDGTVRCWGQALDWDADLEKDTTATPVVFPGLSNVTEVDVHRYSGFAILEGGDVVGWSGYDEASPYTNGLEDRRGEVVPIEGVSGVIEVSIGGPITSCELTENGAVYCQAFPAGSGALGNGTWDASMTPVRVTGIDSAVTVDCGQSSACAIEQSGDVYCWGSMRYVGMSSNVPVRIEEIPDAIDVTAGSAHRCAVLSDGTVWCWGINLRGQLGNGTTDEESRPTQVIGVDDAISVEAGGYSTCVLRQNGKVACWGRNSHGQLGDGTTEDRTTPVEVLGLPPVAALDQTIPAIVHRCVLAEDGTVWCWGFNDAGQLGIGTYEDSLTPVQVPDW